MSNSAYGLTYDSQVPTTNSLFDLREVSNLDVILFYFKVALKVKPGSSKNNKCKETQGASLKVTHKRLLYWQSTKLK